jgi:hypothetical protein
MPAASTPCIAPPPSERHACGDWNEGTFTTGTPANSEGQGRPPAASLRASSLSARIKPGRQAPFRSSSARMS